MNRMLGRADHPRAGLGGVLAGQFRGAGGGVPIQPVDVGSPVAMAEKNTRFSTAPSWMSLKGQACR